MKKILILVALFATILSINILAEPEILKSKNGLFDYTPYGAIVRYYGDKDVYVPSEIDGHKINQIGVLAFLDLDISSIIIEDGIELINTNAFEGSNIRYVQIPKSVKEIGENAFLNCKKLAIVTLDSDKIQFDGNVFVGTKYIRFDILCTADEKEMHRIISNAKGDINFSLGKIHNSFTESKTKKDVFGNNIFYCKDCGYKDGKYLKEMEAEFEDIPENSWFKEYISIAKDFGILEGKSKTIFDPYSNMTVAEAVKIAAAIHDYQTDYSIDTKSKKYKHWYEPYFKYCRDRGIIEDYIILNPNEKVTRAQMAYLFSRSDTVSTHLNPDVPLTDIPDVHDTTPFAYEILELYRRGVAVGSDNSMNFYPDTNVKRSEVAAFIARIIRSDLRIELPRG